MSDQHLLESVKRHEGFRLNAYRDTEGVWTVGYGHNLEANGVPPRYAQYIVVNRDDADMLLRKDLDNAQADARRFVEFQSLDTVARRNVFVEMTFNLGSSRLRLFRQTLRAIGDNDWETVAAEMLDSRWADQVGVRARTLAAIMEAGHYS